MSRLMLDPATDSLPGEYNPPKQQDTTKTPAGSLKRAVPTRQQAAPAQGLTREEQAYLQKLQEQRGLNFDAARREQEMAALVENEKKNMEAVNAILLQEPTPAVGGEAGRAFGKAIKDVTTIRPTDEPGTKTLKYQASSLFNMTFGALGTAVERSLNILPNAYNMILRGFNLPAEGSLGVQANLEFVKETMAQQEDGITKAAGQMLGAAAPTIIAASTGAGLPAMAAAQLGSSAITAFSSDPDDATLSTMLKGTALEKVPGVGSVIDNLAVSPDDSETERRWKIFLEDMGIGAGVGAGIAAWRRVRGTGKKLKNTVETGHPLGETGKELDEAATPPATPPAPAPDAPTPATNEQSMSIEDKKTYKGFKETAEDLGLEFDFNAARESGVPEELMPAPGTTFVTETVEDSGQLSLGDMGTMPAPKKYGDDQTFALDMIESPREVLPELQAHIDSIGPVTHSLADGSEYTIKATPWINGIDGKLRILVTASDSRRSLLGSVQLYPEVLDGATPKLASSLTQVSDAYKRQGIASAIYQYIDNYIGTIHPSYNQSNAGKSFWKNRVKPPSVDAQADFITQQQRAIDLAPKPVQLELPLADHADAVIKKEAESIGVTYDEAMAAGKQSDEIFSDTKPDFSNVGYSDTVAKLARVIEARPQQRGPVTFREIVESGEALADDVEFIAKVLGRNADDIYNAEATSAIASIIDNLVLDLFERAKVGDFTDPAAAAKFAEYVDNIERFINIAQGNASEQGRALSVNASRSRLLEAGDPAVKAQIENQAAAGIVIDKIKRAGGVQEINNIRQLIEDARNSVAKVGAEIDAETGKAILRSRFTRIKDALIYFRTANLLTGTGTLLRATISTSTRMVGRQLQNVNNAAMTSAIRAVGGDAGTDPMTWGRAHDEFMGMWESTSEAARAAWSSIKTGRASSVTTRHDLAALQPTAISIDMTGKEGYGLYLAKAINGVGLGVDTVGRRALMGLDSFSGVMVYRGYLKGLARQRASAIEDIVERTKFIEDFVSNPPKAAHDDAVALAQRMGDTNNPESWMGKFYANPLGFGPASKDIGRLLFPFGNTRGAALENGLAMFPGTNLIVKRVRDDLFSGDNARRTKALSEAMIGMEFIGLMWGLMEAGVITPSGTTDRRVLNQLNSEDGWKPGSLKTPAGYVEVPNVQPLQAPLQIASMLYQMAKAGDEDHASWTAVSGAVLMTMFKPDEILGVYGTFSDMSDAALQGNETKLADIGAAWTAQFGASFVPFQPTVRDANRLLFDNEVKDFKSFDAFADTLRARFESMIPGVSESVPPKRNLFGKPVYIQRGFSLDYADVASEDKKDLATLDALRSLTEYGKRLPMVSPLSHLEITEMPRSVPATHIYGAPASAIRVPLTPDEYDRMTYNVGTIKYQGKTMSEALHDLLIGGKASLDLGGDGLDTSAARHIKEQLKTGRGMGAEGYATVMAAVKQIISLYRNKALAEMSQEPDVKRRGLEIIKASNTTADKRLDNIIKYGGQ